MMNFYQDPILGTQYDFVEPAILLLDLAVMPEDFNVEEFLKVMRLSPLLPLQPRSMSAVEPIFQITNIKVR